MAADLLEKDYGYLQHGSANNLPLRTEKVPVRPRGWPHTGDWVAFYEGRWRVVHPQRKRLYIVYCGIQINITIEGV